jgi:hypothetical protein
LWFISVIIIFEKETDTYYFINSNFSAMAIAIKSVPVLLDDTAVKFTKNADENKRKGAYVDFSEELKIARRILQKSKLK